MNNKELTAELSARLGITQAETSALSEEFVQTVTNELIRGNTVHFQGFGTFEVRKKEERVSVNPATSKRTLIPPKLAVAFKMSNTLKDKINNKEQ